MKKALSCFCVCLSLCFLLAGCGSASEVAKIRGASQAVEDKLLEAFSSPGEDAAIALLDLKESDLAETKGDETVSYKTYLAPYTWCGIKLDTKLSFGYGMMGNITANTVFPGGDEKELQDAGRACFDLFQAQFGDPYSYLLESGQGGTNMEYPKGGADTVFQDFWESAQKQLVFRFSLNGEQNSAEWIEYRIQKNGDYPAGGVELHFSLVRDVLLLKQ